MQAHSQGGISPPVLKIELWSHAHIATLTFYAASHHPPPTKDNQNEFLVS